MSNAWILACISKDNGRDKEEQCLMPNSLSRTAVSIFVLLRVFDVKRRHSEVGMEWRFTFVPWPTGFSLGHIHFWKLHIESYEASTFTSSAIYHWYHFQFRYLPNLYDRLRLL